MPPKKTPPVINPGVDLFDILTYLVGETGAVHESMGGFKINVFHTRAFPWDDVFKALLYRDFRVHLSHVKADIYIEALP